MCKNCENIYLRKLSIQDASVSVSWRNDPHVWRYTGKRPAKKITIKDELNWLRSVTNESNSYRFAILVREEDNFKYVGNVQITNIEADEGEFHIFIGDRAYWGKGIGFCATRLICFHVFSNLSLNSLFLSVNSQNVSAIKIYSRSGFEAMGSDGETIRMHLLKDRFFEVPDHHGPDFYNSRLII